LAVRDQVAVQLAAVAQLTAGAVEDASAAPDEAEAVAHGLAPLKVWELVVRLAPPAHSAPEVLLEVA